MDEKEKWDKFCEAKDNLIDELNIVQSNLLLEEAGSKVRLRREGGKE